MPKLLHIQEEILVLLSKTAVAPSLPPPPELQFAVASLIEAELIHIDCSNRIALTDTGRSALHDLPGELFGEDADLSLASSGEPEVRPGH
jgi:hypothetical protein